MTPEQFCYWLQGYVELNGSAPGTTQWAVIRDHLALVFDKKTPARDPGKIERAVIDQKAKQLLDDFDIVNKSWRPPTSLTC